MGRPARLRRLRELTALAAVLADTADEQALRWVIDELPAAFLLGAVQITGDLAGVDLAGVDLDAMAVLARDTYGNLLAATDGVRLSTKALVRRLAKEHIAAKLVRGQTAVEAGQDLAKALAGEGITAITYADGSRHGLADYAGMLLRTQSAIAYSTGNLAATDAAGIEWVEVLDGHGCGWRSHEDPDKANGSVRAVEEAQNYPVAHPRCTRSFTARPDITSATHAASATGTATAVQNADQATVAASRELAVARRAAAKAVGVRIDRRTQQILAAPGTRVVNPAYARRIAAHQIRTDMAGRLAARQARLARRTASRGTTNV
jgi:hypothetical protein